MALDHQRACGMVSFSSSLHIFLLPKTWTCSCGRQASQHSADVRLTLPLYVAALCILMLVSFTQSRRLRPGWRLMSLLSSLLTNCDESLAIRSFSPRR